MNTDHLRIELTKEQQDQIKEATGQQVDAVELSVEELEQRVAPMTYLKYDLNTVFVSAY